MPRHISPLPRRHFLSLVLAGLGGWAGGLAGCASALVPSVYTLSEDELRQLLARQFPMRRRVLELVDLTLGLPALQLLPQTNRLAMTLGLDAQYRPARPPLQAQLAFDAALRLEPSDLSIRLDQVRVNALQFDAANTAAAGPQAPGAVGPAEGSSQLKRLGTTVAERLLEGLSLYRPSPERQAELQRHGVRPTAVAVTARGVEITLGRAAP